MIALLILLIALQLADWWSTREILAHGGREKNPAVRWLMGKLGVDLALGVKTLAVVAVGYALLSFPWPFLALLCGLYLYVVISNLSVLRRLKAKGN